MTEQTPIFVLSSGRTGSTFLARIINRHPRMACMSDLFEPVGEVPYFDRDRRVDGEEFFRILSAPSFPQRIAYWRHQANAELLYMPEDDRLVSLLLTYTLPFLTDGSPMDLYGQLRAATRTWPERPMPEHLTALFDWLRRTAGKEIWVERTGGSLPHTAQILETWPGARVVLNTRDSRETAISMMTGSFFRLYLALTEDPAMGAWDWTVMPPIEKMGAMLDGWVVDACEALESFPAEQQTRLAYEDLLARPVETLLAFSEFVLGRPPEDEDRAWAEAEAQRIRPAPLRFPELPAGERRRLAEAVARSQTLLGYD